MESICSGNLNEENSKNLERRGWLIGNFREADSVFKTENFELKWFRHPKGKCREIAAMQMSCKSLCILIDGRWIFNFPNEKKKIILSKQ